MKTQRQRFLAVLLAVLILLTYCSIGLIASAANEVTASGTAGKSTTWTLYSSGLLEFKGSGEITEKLTSNYPWCTYNKSVQSVSFAEGITRIPANIFDYNGAPNAHYYSNLSGELVIPSTVTEIGEKAFHGVGITSLVFANGSLLKKIGAYAFGGSIAECTTDTYLSNYPHSMLSGKIVLPVGLTEIADGVFNNCLGITEINIPANIKTIGNNAFANCYSLEIDLVIPDSVTSIGNNAFSHCNSIKSLSLGKSVKAIGAGAFYMCETLSGKLTIPASVESIGYGEYNKNEVLAEDGAFSYCKGITELVFETGSKISVIGRCSFLECSISDSTVVPTVKYLGVNAFYPHDVNVTVNSLKKVSAQGTEAEDQCAHVVVNVDGVAPTCTTEGMTASSYCSVCGEVIEYQVILAKLGHNYIAYNTVAPTCSAEGYTEYRCTRCNNEKKADISATIAHTSETIAAEEPTCTTDGRTAGVKCSVCGKVFTASKVISATGHSYNEAVTAPTCTAKGYITYTCTVCGDKYTGNETEKVAHIAYTSKAAVNAICTTSGNTAEEKCSICGATITASETISATGHSYNEAVTAPTCTAKGYTTYTCTVCGDTYTGNETEKVSHTEITIPAVAATCTAKGLTEGKKCSVCGTVTVAQTEIPMLSHTTDGGVVTKAPTCTAKGVKTYTCTACQTVLSTEEIAKIDHSYNTVVTDPTCTAKGYTTYTCTICGETYTGNETEKVSHTEITIPAVAATCTAKGLTEGKKCSVCGTVTVAQTEIPILSHTTDGGVVTKAATCTAKGVKTYTCTACQTVLSTEEIAKTDHSYKTVVTDPTCTANGYTTYTCTKCGDNYVADTTAKLAHSEIAIPAVTATCTAKGLTEGKKCSVCGTVTVAQTEIPMTAHSETVIEAIPSTFTNTGLTEGKVCTVCGTVTIAQKTIEKLSHADNDDKLYDTFEEDNRQESTCTHICHQSGFMDFIWKIVNLFNKMFKSNQYCTCGAAHW